MASLFGQLGSCFTIRRQRGFRSSTSDQDSHQLFFALHRGSHQWRESFGIQSVDIKDLGCDHGLQGFGIFKADRFKNRVALEISV